MSSQSCPKVVLLWKAHFHSTSVKSGFLDTSGKILLMYDLIVSPKFYFKLGAVQRVIRAVYHWQVDSSSVFPFLSSLWFFFAEHFLQVMSFKSFSRRIKAMRKAENLVGNKFFKLWHLTLWFCLILLTPASLMMAPLFKRRAEWELNEDQHQVNFVIIILLFILSWHAPLFASYFFVFMIIC